MKSDLTPRLRAVASAVIELGECEKMCDVGCDHAYLPIYLLKKGKIKKAYACDVREGPLKAAEKNIALNGFENGIKIVLSDGLKEVKNELFDCITVCGMGGILISKIISEAEECAKKAGRLILQPMSEAEHLRKYLFDNGFTIYDEKIAREDERYYSIICVRKGIEESYDSFDLKFGKKIFDCTDCKNDDVKRYLIKNLKALERNLEAKKNSGRENTDELSYIVEKLKKHVNNFLKNER